jgi:phage gp29-like protein
MAKKKIKPEVNQKTNPTNIYDLQYGSDSSTESLLRNYRTRTFQDIQKWLSALRAAETQLVRKELVKLYRDISIDPDVVASLRYVKQQILSIPFSMKKPDGTVDEEFTAYIKQEWMDKYLQSLVEVQYLGPVALKIEEISSEGLEFCEVPREFYIPEMSLYTENPYSHEGQKLDDDINEPWFIEFYMNERTDLGLFNSCAVSYINKKACQSEWAESIELVGIPARVLKLESSNPQTKRAAFEDLKKMSSAGVMVLGKNDVFEWGANGANADVYQTFLQNLQYNNDNLQKVILGSTLILENSENNGSQSTTSVHVEEFHKMINGLLKKFTYHINESLIERIKYFGFFSSSDSTFSFDQDDNLDPKEQMAIDAQLLQYYIIDEEYIKEKYGTEVLSQRTIVNSFGQQFNAK